MKSKLKYFFLSVCILAVILDARSQGYIVPDGIVTDWYPGEIDLNWPEATEANGFLLNPIGQQKPTKYYNIFSFDEPATVGVRVFLVAPNDPISLQAIQSLSYTEFQIGPSYVLRAGGIYYVGLYSGVNFVLPNPPAEPTPPYTYIDPVFGWAELENVNGTIEVINSALEDQGGGIIAGTQTILPVPEPSTIGMGVLGLGSLFLSRYRTQE